MKKPILPLIFLFTFLLSFLSIQAQDDELVIKEKYSEFGINATGFINEFISLNSNDSDLGDYMITYKYHTDKLALRLGLGGQIRQMNDETEGGGDRATKDNQLDFRVGVEVKKRISKRWAFYSGVDAIVGMKQTQSTTFNFEEVKITNNSTNFGGGPIVGIQFFINSHISLATEGSLYFQSTLLKEKQEFSVNSEFNTDDSSTINDLNFGLPTALFFIVKF